MFCDLYSYIFTSCEFLQLVRLHATKIFGMIIVIILMFGICKGKK